MGRLDLFRWPVSLALIAVVAACSGAKTGKPAIASAPPLQLAKGDGYRRAYPAFANQSAIAASNFNRTSGNATIEYLIKGADPVKLSAAGEPLSVKVAPELPATALFIDDPSTEAIGTLKLIDLAAKPVAATAIPSAAIVPSNGFFYGAAGDQILFVAAFDPASGLGKLFWSDGATSHEIGSQVSPQAIQFDAARKTAVAALGIAPEGAGSLVAIDMKTGGQTPLANGAVIFGHAHETAFALSTDGTQVAFTSTAGALLRAATSGGDPTTLAEKGTLPGISGDGQLVAYYADDKLFVWANGVSTLLGDVPDSLRPIFSPDRKWVAYFTNITVAGSGAGAVGDAWLLPSVGNAEPVKLGSSVGVDTVLFGSKMTRISTVSDLVSLSGMPTYDAIGNLWTAVPGQPAKRFAVGTQPGNVTQLEVSDALVYIGAMQAGNPVGAAFAVGADGVPVKLADKVVPSSIRVPTGFDSIVFIGDPEDKLIDSTWRVGALFGSTVAGPAKKLVNAESGVIQAVFGRDGRALTVIATGDKAGVWTLPPQ